jgi:hypothetical protein
VVGVGLERWVGWGGRGRAHVFSVVVVLFYFGIWEQY